jgi:hypothetical protein
MTVAEQAAIDVTPELLEAIAHLPVGRTVLHCGQSFTVSSFDVYATCPHCGNRLKLRSFAAVPELEDVFDAVFAWMNQPGAAEVVEQRRREIAADEE